MHYGKPALVNSLSLRILLVYVAGALLSIGLLLGFGAMVKDRLPGMTLAERTLALALAGRLQFDSRGNPTGFSDCEDHPLWIHDSLRHETAWRVLDDQVHTVLVSAGATRWPDHSATTPLPDPRFEFTFGEVLYDGAREMRLHDHRRWYVELAISSRIINFLHQSFALPFIRLGVMTFSLLLFIVFAILVSVSLKYALRPMRKISQAALQISPQSIGERLETGQVPTELSPLIASFNQVLDRLEKGFRSQQDFFATAAHELKTPLTILRAEVEFMAESDPLRGPLLAQVMQLARQVQQLLLLVEAIEPLSYRFTDVYPCDVARDAVDYLQKIADDMGVKLTVRGDEEAGNWQADRGAFFILLKNLIENAVQHSPVGAMVSIDVRAESLSVKDQGTGVEPENISHIFERFWRGARRRDTGAGLGLAVCQEICTAHGWVLTACNGDIGLTVSISKARHAS